MNSWSRKDYYYDDDCEPCKKRKKDDYDDHKPCKKEKKDCPLVLKCNTASFGPTLIQIPDDPQQVIPINQPIASVTIDARHLCRPTIKVDFSGILTAIYSDFDETITYNFTLYRNCKGDGARQSLRSFTVAQLFADSDDPDSRGLAFVYSECDIECFDCCTYTLELSSINATDTDETLNLSITGTLCVLAVSSDC